MTDSPEPPPSKQELEAKLVKKLEPLVKPGKAGEVVNLVEMTVSRFHSGPLPPADEFASYEASLTGSADRILTMAEKSQKHRHDHEITLLRGEIAIRILGQLGALATIAILGALVAYCAYLKQPISATVIAAMGAAAAYFLHKHRKPQAVSPEKQAPSKRRRK